MDLENREKRLAIRRLKRGNPHDIIRLYEAQVVVLKQQLSMSKCKGCAKSFYDRKIKKYEEEIKNIKNEKKFRNINWQQESTKNNPAINLIS